MSTSFVSHDSRTESIPAGGDDVAYSIESVNFNQSFFTLTLFLFRSQNVHSFRKTNDNFQDDYHKIHTKDI